MDPPYRVLTSPSSTYDEFGKFIAKEYTKFPTLNYMLFKNAVVHTLSRFVEEDISNIVQCYPPIFRTAPPLVDHYILGSPYNSAFAISHFYGALHTPHISLYEKPLDAERERLYTDKARLDADKARLDAYTARFDAIDEHEKRVLDNLEISPRTFDTLFISFGKQSLVNIPIGSNINNIGHNNIDSLYTMDTMAKASFVEGAVAALKAVALAAVIAMSTSSGVSDKVHD